jgi:hypothetical protein
MMNLLCSRVVEIMRMDAQKDPSIDPDVARARLIVDQVLFFFIRIHIIYYI